MFVKPHEMEFWELKLFVLPIDVPIFDKSSGFGQCGFSGIFYLFFCKRRVCRKIFWRFPAPYLLSINISNSSCLALAECGFSCGQNSVRPSLGAIKWFKWPKTRPSLPAPSSSKSCEYFHILWIPEEGQEEYYILTVPKWFFLVLKGVGATPERYVFFPDSIEIWVFYSRSIEIFGLRNDLFYGFLSQQFFLGDFIYWPF